MTIDDFRQLLLDWQRWYFSDRTLRGLGIAQSGYAERVGRAHSTSDPANSIDIEVLAWHEFYSKRLIPEIHVALDVDYLRNGKRPAKAEYLGVKDRDYRATIDYAIMTACRLFTSDQAARKSAQETADDTA